MRITLVCASLFEHLRGELNFYILHLSDHTPKPIEYFHHCS
jgi:hypothetical protein